MKSNTLNTLDVKLEPLEIDLKSIEITPNTLDITLQPLPDVKLNNYGICLEPVPVNLDNTLFDLGELTSFEDLGGLV